MFATYPQRRGNKNTKIKRGDLYIFKPNISWEIRGADGRTRFRFTSFKVSLPEYKIWETHASTRKGLLLKTGKTKTAEFQSVSERPIKPINFKYGAVEKF